MVVALAADHSAPLVEYLMPVVDLAFKNVPEGPKDSTLRRNRSCPFPRKSMQMPQYHATRFCTDLPHVLCAVSHPHTPLYAASCRFEWYCSVTGFRKELVLGCGLTYHATIILPKPCLNCRGSQSRERNNKLPFYSLAASWSVLTSFFTKFIELVDDSTLNRLLAGVSYGDS
jgi:hypothetical protein